MNTNRPQAGCTHECTIVAGRKPKDVPELQWINTVPGNLKTSLTGSYHSFGFRKYAAQYLGTFAYRFNSIEGSISRHCPNACWWPPRSAGSTRSARFGMGLKFIANQEISSVNTHAE